MDYYVGDDYTVRFFEGHEAEAVERGPFALNLVDDPAPDLSDAADTLRTSRITVVAEGDDVSYLAIVVSTPHFEESSRTGELLMSGNTLVVREVQLLSESDLEDLGPRILDAISDSAEETGFHQVIAAISDNHAELFTAAGWTVESADTGWTWMEQPGIVITEDGGSHPMVGLGKVPPTSKLLAHRTVNDELLAAPFTVGGHDGAAASNALIEAASNRSSLPAWLSAKLER